jgi:hypothetical protein
MTPHRPVVPRLAAVLVPLGLLQGACAGPEPATAVAPVALRSFDHCPWDPPPAAPRLRLADTPADRAQALAQGLGVDAARSRLVLVELGEQPSGGHRLALAAAGLQRRHGTLVVTVTHQRPAPDALVTQALTQPCLALVVPREGWHRAELAGLP